MPAADVSRPSVMNILLLDSATEACTCALSVDSRVTAAFEIAPRGHAQLLLPMAEGLLRGAGIDYEDLDLIAYGRGPGSFTGVRIGMGCAMGIASSLDLPMVGVSSLETLALAVADQANDGDTIHAAIDARMGEVYYAGFIKESDGSLRATGEERVVRPEDLCLTIGLAVGTGFAAYPELLLGAQAEAWRLIDGQALPHAGFGMRLALSAPRGDWVAAAEAEPVYLRNDVAKPPKAPAL